MSQQREILHNLFVVTHHLKQDFKEFVSQSGLSEMEAKFVFHIGAGLTKTSELIDHFQKHKSTIRQKTRSLEEKKFITMSSSTEDGRERIVHLTKKGKDFYVEIKKLEKDYHKRIFKKFTKKDEQDFISLLDKLIIEENHGKYC